MKAFSELTSASQVNNGDLLAISQTSGSGYASKKTTVKDITDKSNLNLAEEYDSTSTYAVDDYVIYESVLYKCIGTTTGTFDSTKWTSVVVTDEMGSGGGGGTGGHTIIDENGNSMTARAGLQFVGGANVSDDSTNNKTIVDVASAGGIDGVFIDATNVIHTISDGNDSFKEWIATDDCYIIGTIKSSQSPAVQIDGITVAYLVSASETIGVCVIAKKGQSVKYRMSAQSTLTAYGIQTGTTHSKFQPVIYSTEEREIGVWTDGKPLYVRTYNVTFSSNYTDVTIDTTHEVKLLDGGVDSNANDNFIHLGYETSQNDMCGAYEYEAGKIRFQNFYYSSRPNGWLNVFYTKTTDVAGSGSWTPQGVPTHHYSTDEQIVGTWIDGKTLYEKTISSDLTLSTASWQNYTSLANLNLLSVDKVIITRDGEQVPMAFSPYMIVAWIVRDNYLKFIIQSSTSVAETIVLKSCTIQYTKSS